MAAELGFEPRQTESESAVLPLHNSASLNSNNYYIVFKKNVNTFCRIFYIFLPASGIDSPIKEVYNKCMLFIHGNQIFLFGCGNAVLVLLAMALSPPAKTFFKMLHHLIYKGKVIYMKYAVVLCDGMADYPVEALQGKTPMAAAEKPCMNELAEKSEVGLVKTVADGLKPGSDVANLSVMGYDPAVYYTGRSPLEAASIGISLKDDDVTLRCNLVTLSDEEKYEEKTMVDYCADDISTEEAAQLVHYLQLMLGNNEFKFYSGVSYRHCLVWAKGDPHPGVLTPPHDISGKKIKEYTPQGENAQKLFTLMVKSHELLRNHPVNVKRIQNGKRPANSIWLWGEGQKPKLDSFEDKFGLRGSVVSAVDLLKGIGICAKMRTCDVPGATGYIDTNFDGKLEAAVQELKAGQDFVYIHIEAPDECGHRGEVENKVKSIELIDRHILAPLVEEMKKLGDYSLLVLPDHPTPLSIRTHISDPVPYLLYRSSQERESGVVLFDEENAAKTGVFIEKGHTLMNRFLQTEK